MQSDTRPDTPREAGRDSHHDGGYDGGQPPSEFDQPIPPKGSEGFAQSSLSRKLAWTGAVLLLAATVGAAVWAAKAWQTNRTLANVESSLAARSLPAVSGNDATAVPSDRAPDVVAAPAAVSADRLPALVLPGQPVPAAVLRDLPEWVAAEMGTVETSGGSGDESAAPPASPAIATAAVPVQAMQQAPARPARSEGYGAVFKRCPGPGQSGAVECRRAVCDGAAKKLSACAPYLK
ncbi:hypothetical protein [Pseudoduganella lutea]|uniref:Uncharacterized protein n=1 Tax=Pseudoduganella lutea TaxID=321985 RepID=A0A4P6L4L0_9BURK|nr:hypothetical protein [Pseudoduganella lutea]QBE66530.1 hypothetical protein EWM63_29135 [Pseudoduganella lutea]